MKILRYRYCFLLFIFMTLISQQGVASQKSFLEDVKNRSAKFENRSVPLSKVIDEETVLSKQDYQAGSFWVLARKKQIERYKCSSCHTDKPVAARQGLALTHGNIWVEHGKGDQGLSCIDCHHPDERDFLEDKKGRKIDFDHSYQLCGQCHFRQKRDWLGGAHGKRVNNWAGERVVYSCTSCHDAHSPRFKKRFPATYSVPLD